MLAAAAPGFLPTAALTPQFFVVLLIGAAVLALTTLFFCIFGYLKKRELQATQQELAVCKSRSAEQEIRAAKLITILKNDRRHSEEKLRFLEDARNQLQLHFTNLAQQIFDEKSARFSDLNKERLEAILSPFNHQLTAFKQEINELSRTDMRERQSLKTEILQLREQNQKLNHEAMNLTRALKNDTKVQGTWGELILNQVLEQSGLRQGHEFDVQEGFYDTGHRLQRPDVIIHLPDGRDVIIDSKVSLVSWERYINCQDENEGKQHLNQLVKAIHDHIAGLATKNYQSLPTVRTLDFVLMFLPIESAFAAALQADESLITKALAGNIILVSPTTLLAALRTIDNIWKYDRQNKNSMEIARRAGLMYDKFRGFILEMEKLGKQLATCHTTYEAALQKLTQGRGNLVAQAEQLRQMGIQIRQELPRSITDSHDETLEEDEKDAGRSNS